MRLHGPIISPVPTICKITGSSGIVLERPKQPVQNRFAESPAIRVAERAAVTDGDVAFPRWYAGREIVEVALALGIAISQFLCYTFLRACGRCVV
jgi:hypothetical protein